VLGQELLALLWLSK